MSKKEVLAEFVIDIKNPGSEKDGNYMYDLIIKRAKHLILEDRFGVIGVLKEWLSLRKDPLTMIAVNLTTDLIIPELKPDLEILRKEIASGKVFLPYYNEWVDKALKAIS